MNALNGSLVSYLHPANHIPRKIRKDEKDFSSKPDLKDLIFTKLKRSIASVLVFLVMKKT